MAVDAVYFIVGRAMTEDVVHQIAMTVQTISLQNSLAHRAQPDGFWKVLQREALGMPETVLRLDQILGDQRMRDVAIVAGRRRVMAGFLPAVVLLSHDVAVDARLGIVAQVRESL